MKDDRMEEIEKRKAQRRLELRRAVLDRRFEDEEAALYLDMRSGIERRRWERRHEERRHIGNA